MDSQINVSNEMAAKTELRKKKKWKKGTLTPYLFITPHLLFFLIFLVLPTLHGIYISFHSWNFFSDPVFVGFQNYADILFNKDSLYYEYYWMAFRATLIFVVFSVPFLIFVPLIIAIAMNNKPFGNTFFRVLFYAPSLFSVATVVLIWVWMLDTNAGLVNYYLVQLGFDRIPWLTSIPWAWVGLVIMTIWWTMGYNMILFLAGLQDVPEQLYEAAKIDGANFLQRFWHITIPGIKGPLLYVLVMTTIASFNVFGQPFLATDGAPGRETRVLMMYIRDVAFAGSNPRAGMGAAMSIVMGVFMLIVTIIQFKLMNPKQKKAKMKVS
ncbi:MAG: carbohydrate ABC transporter permease [Anaerobacillus sp.]|uniref:carbohydrate ABC transporter permease n=1 Tax=Anaerobacillus sp. TaxID=1872506 RepID=UPI00391BFD6F